MAAGIQAWDQNGSIILDTNIRTVKIQGSGYTGTGGGSISIDTSQGTPFFQVFTYASLYYDSPTFTLNGGTLSWIGSGLSVFIIWGTF